MGVDIPIPNFINSTIDIYDFPEKIMGNGINENVVVSTHTVRIYLRFATEFLEYFSESHSSGFVILGILGLYTISNAK